MKIAFFVFQDFNLGAAYVIAYLKQIGHEVRLFLNRPLGDYNPDLICISCVTANVGWALNTAKRCWKVRPRADIVFGGVHPTLCPEDFGDYNICQGDGLKYFGGKFEPDKLWPDREIFFEQLPLVHRRYQIFMTGFGCPFRCSFCNTHQLNKKLIRRDVWGCLNELHHLKRGGMRYVLFDDDIFTINKSWLQDFLNNYIRLIRLPFTCFGHPKFIDKEIVQWLNDANCQCIWLGVQTGSESVRRMVLNRHETNKEIKEACKLIKANGMKLMIDHIFGIPGDNDIVQSYEFYRSLKPDVVNCYELLYLPKAEINEYGYSSALYQREGGKTYKAFVKPFASIPLMVH